MLMWITLIQASGDRRRQSCACDLRRVHCILDYACRTYSPIPVPSLSIALSSQHKHTSSIPPDLHRAPYLPVLHIPALRTPNGRVRPVFAGGAVDIVEGDLEGDAGAFLCSVQEQ